MFMVTNVNIDLEYRNTTQTQSQPSISRFKSHPLRRSQQRRQSRWSHLIGSMTVSFDLSCRSNSGLHRSYINRTLPNNSHHSLLPFQTLRTQRILGLPLFSTNLPVHGTLLINLLEFDSIVRCELSVLFLYPLYLCMLFVDLFVVRPLGKGRKS